MRKMMAVWLVMIALGLLGGVRFAQAQEQQEQKDREEQTEAKSAKSTAPENKPKAEQREKILQPYRVDFSLNEIEDGKKINGRHYAMNLNAGDRNQIKIGTRVPVSQGPNRLEYQYMDVGTNIMCYLEERGDKVAIEVNTDVSNFSSPAEGENPHPVVRQIHINGSSAVIPGKPVVMGTVDDPNSKREFQLEVQVTKLR